MKPKKDDAAVSDEQQTDNLASMPNPRDDKAFDSGNGEHLPSRSAQRKFKTVITGAEFKEFEIGEVFEGQFIEVVKREKDGPNAATNPNEKAGTTMGYLFKPDGGFSEIIGASHSINEVMNNCKIGTYCRFTFLGKGENSKKQPFNRFQIEVEG